MTTLRLLKRFFCSLHSFFIRPALIVPLCVMAMDAGMVWALSDAHIREAAVKIYTVTSEPVYGNPWMRSSPSEATGSGCIIDGHRILTNAHVISDSTFVEVRFHGDPTRYPARVVWASHEADLAVLTVDDISFFEGVTPLELGALPQPRDPAVVYGFPTGGDSLSTTEGVVSRIEHQHYAHSGIYLLAMQLDAAINSGNSGGPVIAEGKVVGIAMQTLGGADNIGYVIPVPVIQQFLTDVADGELSGIPSLGIHTQNMENDALQSFYGLTDDATGVIVTHVIPGMPAEGKLTPGDVILSVDGRTVAGDQTVEFRPQERTHMNFYIDQHQLGESVDMDILRDGKPQKLRIILNRTVQEAALVPPLRYDTSPSYFIYGGLVFSTLTTNYLDMWDDENYGASFSHLRWLRVKPKTIDGEEAIFIVKILPSYANRGYHDLVDRRIVKVNGQPVQNLEALVAAVESCTDQVYVRFEDVQDTQIVLKREQVEAEHQQILDTYGVPVDRSEDLRR